MPAETSSVRLFVIIPVHNRRDFTRQCLAHLRAQTWRDLQVIVVDDGSSDGTAEMIAGHYPQTIVMRGDGSLWWTGAMNLGVKEALARGATHILTMNDDTNPPPEFVERIVETALQLPGTIVGAAAMDAVSGELCFAGERIAWLRAGTTSLLASSTARAERIAEVSHAPGRGLLIPADVFRKIGLFDEVHLPHYAADYDFTHRAIRAGYRVVCDRSAVLGAYPEASGGSTFRRNKNWKNYRQHLFHIKSDANIRVFFWYALRNCPWYQLPVCLTVGLLRRMGGYLLEWVRPAPERASKMRIAFVTNFASHYRVGMFESLARSSDLQCYFHSDGGEWYWQREHGVSRGEFPFQYLRGIWLGRLRVVPGLIPALFLNRHDVIVKCINDRFSVPVSYLAARLRRVPFVLWTGIWCRLQTRSQKLLFPFTRRLYRNADAVVAYGEHVRQYLILEGVEPRRIFLAPQAVDNEAYRRAVASNEKLEAIEQLALPDGAKVLLYVGRLEAVKGLEYLLDGFAAAETAGAVLVLCGTGSLRDALQERAARLGIAGRVRFAGFLAPPDLVRFYSIAWAAILPSISTPGGRETWGLVANEAFNQGVPLIATEAVGAVAGGLVRHLRNGLVTAEQDAAALSAAITRIVSEPELRNTLGAQARLDVAGWTHERMAAGFLEAASYAIGQRRGGRP